MKMNPKDIIGPTSILVGAVSYTHLDVYKRQHWRSSGRQSLLCRNPLPER